LQEQLHLLLRKMLCSSVPSMRQLLELCVWQVVAYDVRDSAAVIVCLKAATMQSLQDNQWGGVHHMY
jgi:hypothetical protein